MSTFARFRPFLKPYLFRMMLAGLLVMTVAAINLALLRLAGAVLVEQHDEWQVGDRRYLSEGSMAALIAVPSKNTALPATAMLTAS